MSFHKIIPIIVFCLTCFGSNAQTVQMVERNTRQYLDSLDNWDSKERAGHEVLDSGFKTTMRMLWYLEDTLAATPETFTADFTSSKGVRKFRILTSDDNKLRIYNWNVDTVVCPAYDAIAQYKSEGKVHTDVLSNTMWGTGTVIWSGSLYQKLITVHAKSGKTIYLALSHSGYSDLNCITIIQAFSIAGSKLIREPIFRSARGWEDEIDIDSYTIILKNEPSIALSADNKQLYVPVFNYDKDTFKGYYRLYQFNGYAFIYKGNVKR